MSSTDALITQAGAELPQASQIRTNDRFDQIIRDDWTTNVCRLHRVKLRRKAREYSDSWTVSPVTHNERFTQAVIHQAHHKPKNGVAMRAIVRLILRTVFYSTAAALTFISLSLLLFIVSSVMLNQGVISSNPLLIGYQSSLYWGAMKSWVRECAVFDHDLIYIPKTGRCRFDTREFRTISTFDQSGRFSGDKSDQPGIAVLGDSFAMGFGVNDNETYSAVLERMINRPVYNLGVASYATYRELLRLERSGLISRIDTVIIQYCDNDLNENVYGIRNFTRNGPVPTEARDLYDSMYHSIPAYRAVFFWLKAAVNVPAGAAKRAFSTTHEDFSAHDTALSEILSKFPWLLSKKVIIFYANIGGRKYSNFEELGNKDNPVSAVFIDISTGPGTHYVLDGHLNKLGHQRVAEKLSSLMAKISG